MGHGVRADPAGALLPATPAAHLLGFSPLPLGFFAALVLLIASYLILVKLAKRASNRRATATAPGPPKLTGGAGTNAAAPRVSALSDTG
jgi:hypothetical protein